MQLWGIACVRNEVDIVDLHVAHHFSQGFDRFLVIDNESTDGTTNRLSQLARKYPLEYRRRSGAFLQADWISELAQEARLRGADWVCPLDADEFWMAQAATIKDVLEDTWAGAISVGVINFVQSERVLVSSELGLLSMTKRPAAPLGPPDEIESHVREGRAAYLQIEYPRKWIARTTPTLTIGWGNHQLTGEIPPVEATDAIVCLHAPLRSRQSLADKADVARSAPDVERYHERAWHIRRWRQLAERGALDDEWKANSYCEATESDSLDDRWITDTRLRDVVQHQLRERTMQIRGTNPIRRQATDVAPRIWGLTVVRNEADIIELTLRHHFRVGIERILAVDNGSTDGTWEMLQQLSAELPIDCTRNPGPFRQSEIVTGLAHQAFRRGATWVLPFDADEFWDNGSDSIAREIVDRDIGAVICRVVNYVQARNETARTHGGLTNMIWRPQHVRGPFEAARRLVESRTVPFVEAMYPPKLLLRASPRLQIAPGNHHATGVAGRLDFARELECLHAPLRSRAVLEAQAEHGSRLNDLGVEPDIGWHVRHWHRLAREVGLDAEWNGNSAEADMLDFDGQSRALVVDRRLAQLAASSASTTAVDDKRARLSQGVSDPATVGAAAVTVLDRAREGWFSREEAEFLASGALQAHTACPAEALFVEVGSFAGRSTAVLAAAVKAIGADRVLHAIDPHTGSVGAVDSAIGLGKTAPTLALFHTNLVRAGVQDVVRLRCRRSYETQWDRPIGFIFIDGLHDELSVTQDTDHFLPWLVDGGVVAFHDVDVSFPGVSRSVAAAISRYDLVAMGKVQSLAMFKRSGAS